MRKLMKKTGLHWAVRAQLARRGDSEVAGMSPESEIDGFPQSLRDAGQQKTSNNIDANRNARHSTGG